MQSSMSYICTVIYLYNNSDFSMAMELTKNKFDCIIEENDNIY